MLLRQLSAFGLRQTYRLQQTAALRRLFPTHGNFNSNFNSNFNRNIHALVVGGPTDRSRPMRVGIRSLSSNNGKKGGGGGEEDATKEIVLTPGQKVAAASRLTMWAGIAAFACACAYFIGKELLPTKMSPNTVFSKASGKIQENSQVQRKYGTPVKFYGKDHGGHREGRRNFIEHTQYTDPQDGSSRTRVRFNMEGQFDAAFCFAEVSSAMASGEFVYILVQDKRSGRVITVVDNRAALTAQQLAGGNKDTANAMQQLLGGSSSSSK